MRKILNGATLAALAATTLVGALALTPGCAKGAAPTCDNVGVHFMDLVEGSDEMKKQSPESKAAAESISTSFKEEMVKDCKDKKWDDKKIKCVLAAKKVDEIEKCEQKQ
jgi:hypothetical protein